MNIVNFKNTKKKRARVIGGFGLIEIVVGIGMLTTTMVSILLYYKQVLYVSNETTLYIQSGFLLEEGVEAVKMIRDEGWTKNIAPLSTTTTYYLQWSGTKWATTTVQQITENIFVRSFRLSDVKRDGSDNIAIAGTYDPGTKKVTMSVVRPLRGGMSYSTSSAETYITNIFKN